MCSRDPSHFVGPVPLNLLPQAVRCKGPQDRLPVALEGAKMSLSHNRHVAIRYKIIMNKEFNKYARLEHGISSMTMHRYESVLDGDIKDATVNSKKDEMDSAYNSWQEALAKQEPALFENISAATMEVQDVNNQLMQNEKDIFNNEVEVQNWTTAYDIAKDYTASLNSKKSELQSAKSGLDSSNEADADKRALRLLLSQTVAKVIKSAMALLGIEVPNRM